MKIVKTEITGKIRYVSSLIFIKRFFTGQFVREIPGILFNLEAKQALKVTFYITTKEVLIYAGKFDGQKRVLLQIEASDNVSIQDVALSIVGEVVNAVSYAKSKSLETTRPVKAIKINEYMFLPGMQSNNVLTSSIVFSYQKVIYVFGKHYLESIQNLVTLVNSIQNEKLITEVSRFLPGSYPAVAIAKAYLAIVYFPFFFVLFIYPLITKSFPVMFFIFVIIIVGGLAVADRVLKYANLNISR